VGHVALPQPYDFALSTERYRAFGPDLANLWHEGALHRVVDGRDVRITSAPHGVEVEPLDERIEPEVRVLLGAAFDLDGFQQLARDDNVLSRLVPALRGLRPPLNPSPFETLVTSITAQQVSLRSAFAVRNRLIQAFGREMGVVWEFPREERLARAQPEELTALGFSRRKAEYVVGLARAGIPWTELRTLPDDEVKARLVAIRGLGEWTADWFLARHLARPRAWPAGDLGLVKAVATYYFDGARPTIADVRRFGERFAPFENLAAHYLLASLYSASPAV
jgi:DNA-3-methyladenine glycosylase II